MNEQTTAAAPPPVTITIGGKGYTARPPAPEVWREFLKHAAPDADQLDQLVATATVLHEIIGTEAKNEVACRVAAGELGAADIIDAVHDAAKQWREYEAAS